MRAPLKDAEVNNSMRGTFNPECILFPPIDFPR
jgi:hypothetical protein